MSPILNSFLQGTKGVWENRALVGAMYLFKLVVSLILFSPLYLMLSKSFGRNAKASGLLTGWDLSLVIDFVYFWRGTLPIYFVLFMLARRRETTGRFAGEDTIAVGTPGDSVGAAAKAPGGAQRSGTIRKKQHLLRSGDGQLSSAVDVLLRPGLSGRRLAGSADDGELPELLCLPA